MASTIMQEARILATISYHLPCNLPSVHRGIDIAGRDCPKSDKIRRQLLPEQPEKLKRAKYLHFSSLPSVLSYSI